MYILTYPFILPVSNVTFSEKPSLVTFLRYREVTLHPSFCFLHSTHLLLFPLIFTQKLEKSEPRQILQGLPSLEAGRTFWKWVEFHSMVWINAIYQHASPWEITLSAINPFTCFRPSSHRENRDTVGFVHFCIFSPANSAWHIKGAP